MSHDIPLREKPSPLRELRLLWRIFAWSLLVRLLAIRLLHTYRFNPRNQFFGFGGETGRIARSIAWGQGFANPFGDSTGPTAWVAPLYPYIVAGAFKLFGVYSSAAAFALLTLNSVFSALTCVVLYLIAKRCFGPRVALWAGWTCALFPYFIYWPARMIWETSLSVLLLALAFLLTLDLEVSSRWRGWVALGAVWGMLALANPSLLSFLPLSLGWLLYRRGRAGKSWAREGLLTLALCAALAGGWMLHNYRAFGRFVFVRNNFWMEFWLGNSPGADGRWRVALHPSQDAAQFEAYRRRGELGYFAARREEALEFVREHPGRFLSLTLRRVLYFWAGEPKSFTVPGAALLRNLAFLVSAVLAFWGLGRAARQRVPGWFLFAALFLVYPLVYYLTFTHPRYRHAIEPEMLVLIVYLFASGGQAAPDVLE